MPEHDTSDPFETLLSYRSEPPAEDFVAEVMQQVARQQRTRRLILWGSGLAGATFGLTGAAMLSGPIGQAVTAVFASPPTLPTILAATSVVTLLAWFLAEDSSFFG